MLLMSMDKIQKGKVYGDCPGQEFSMVQQQNNTMSKQNDFQDDDLQPPSKRSSSDKQQTKESLVHDDTRLVLNNNSNAIKHTLLVADHEAPSYYSKHQMARDKVGTKVFLKSWKNANKDVALATIISCDPKYKLDGVQLGNEFWMVHVDLAIAKCEELIRPYKGYKLIGHAVGADIACPSTYVDKIDDAMDDMFIARWRMVT